MKYELVKLSAREDDEYWKEPKYFNTHEEVLTELKKHLCETCLSDLNEKSTMWDAFNTMCGAEFSLYDEEN